MNKNIESLVQTCFELIERRVDLQFSFQWNSPKKFNKTIVTITLGDSSEHPAWKDKYGFSTRSDAGIYWICLFRDNIKKFVFEDSRSEGREIDILTHVCIHEVLHILDLMRKGASTKSEQEINQLTSHYRKNPNLPIQL